MNEIPKKLPTAAAVQQSLKPPVPREFFQPDGTLQRQAIQGESCKYA